MAVTVFFSWQSDKLAINGKNFIERALDKAIKAIANSKDLEGLELFEPTRDIELDKDTKDEPGSPPIFETIRQKLDGCALLVSDLTSVANRANGELIPNPNVLVEYGYAYKSLTYRRIIQVMNVAFGTPTRESMPFDLALHRRPITYNLPDDATPEDRAAAKDTLAKTFEDAIRAILKSDAYKESLPKPPQLEPVKYREPLQGHSLFHPRDKPLGYIRNPSDAMLGKPDTEIFMSEAPAIWFRLGPKFPVSSRIKLPDLEKQVIQLFTLPLFGRASGNIVRRADGWACGTMFEPPMMSIVCQVFTDGEIWAVDQFLLTDPFNDGDLQDVISLPESDISRSIERCEEFLLQLSITYPLRLVIGIEGVDGRSLMVTLGGFTGKRGACTEDRIEVERFINSPEDRLAAVEEFFADLYQKCGVRRQKTN